MFKKSKGHYAEHKKSEERNVMSYEDMPLDDYEQEKTEISPEAVKKIIISICVALAAGLIVFAFANRDKLTWDNISTWWTYDVLGNAGDGYPVSIVGSEVKSGNFTVHQDHVAYASDTSFITLNSTGSEVNNVQLRYSKPVMKSSDNRYLTYGLGDTGYQIQNFDENLFSGTADGAIYTGDIASNGSYCLVTEGNGFLTTLLVFNKDNNRIYKYSFSEYYINSVALNNDGSGCVASGVTSNNGAIQTGVYVLDFTKEEPVSVYKIEGDSIIDSKYLTSNKVALVGQKASYIVKVGDENYTTKSYDDKLIANYCFNPDTSSFTLALSKSGDGRSCSLVSYDDDGDVFSTIDTEYGADSISVYKDVVAILDGNTAYAYDTNGKLLYTCDTGTGSKGIILNSSHSAYVLSINQIRLIDLKHPSTADTVRETVKE